MNLVPARPRRFDELGAWLLDLVLALGAALFAVTFLHSTLSGTDESPDVPTTVLYVLVLAHARRWRPGAATPRTCWSRR